MLNVRQKRKFLMWPGLASVVLGLTVNYRLLEIPTPRWTAYDAKRFAVKVSGDVPMITQERAYTSPIWYTP